MPSDTLPEPWLRGPISNVSPLISPVLRSFQQAREDLDRWTEGLTTEQFWATPHGVTAIGFQLRHIAGSVERLTTYAMGNELTERQLAAMKTEQQPGATRDELFAQFQLALAQAEQSIRSLDPAALIEPRTVGRKRLPTTVIGLLVHIAEHTQRHVGEAIAAAKVVRNVRPE